MNRFFSTALLIFVAIFCTLTTAAPFENWTMEYVRSPNLEPGCATHIGPGCDSDLVPRDALDDHGCYPNEQWTSQFCGAPRLITWRLPADLPSGCANRVGPGCEPAAGVPLSDEGCLLHERYILLDVKRQWFGGYCMERAVPSINASKASPMLGSDRDLEQ